MADDPRRRLPADPEAAAAALYEALEGLPGVRARRAEPLARHLPLRCGGPADVWAEVDDLDALRAALRAARAQNATIHLAWPFEDRLVRDGGQRGLVLRPGLGFEGWRLLPADEAGPTRLELGAAAPWAAAGRLRGDTDGPCTELATWTGCPGATWDRCREGLEGLLAAACWLRGRSVERVELPHGAPAPELPRGAILLSVEVPLAWPTGARRLRHRRRPLPLGTLFDGAEDLDAGRQLQAAGLLGARLRTWRMATAEPGTLVSIGPGDARSALLFAKGLAEHVRKVRGVELVQVLPVDGADAPHPDRR